MMAHDPLASLSPDLVQRLGPQVLATGELLIGSSMAVPFVRERDIVFANGVAGRNIDIPSASPLNYHQVISAPSEMPPITVELTMLPIKTPDWCDPGCSVIVSSPPITNVTG